jgi:hypothetical protein
MANEFVARNGLIALDNSTITGSLGVSGGITGSLFGTASWSTNALTASFLSGSVENAVSASFATTASFAISASWAPTGNATITVGDEGTTQGTATYFNFIGAGVTATVSSDTASINIPGGAGSTFPFTGSAIISGSLIVTGSIFVTQSHISTVDYVDFNINAATPTHVEGRIHWDIDRKTLELDTDVNNFMINVGHMNVLRGRNTNPFTLTKGTVVYINGNSGQFATFATASWEDDPRSAYTIGVIAQDVNSNNFGYAITDGEITGINTNAFAPATLLYLSSSGQYTSVVPTAPNHTVRLGQVVVQSTSGILQVKVDNGYELGELHDVRDTTTTSSYGDLLVKSGSIWATGKQLTGSYGLTGSLNITGSLRLSTPTYNTSSINVLTYNTGSDEVEYSTINDLTFTKNIVTVGLQGSRDVNYNVIKTAVESITDAAENNTYTVRVYPGIYIEDTITVPSWVAVKGDSSISTVVSASNPSQSVFVMSDQSMVIDMQVQGSTGPGASAIVYSSATTPQRNAIAYAENIRFGTNYTNAKVIGSGSSGNCILQCSNVKYGGYTDNTLQKSFDVGFHVTSGSSGGIGRMQLRNVTSTNGGVAGTDNNQIFALADAPGCTFIVNGCLLTRATGTARGTGFKVYNGGQLRLTGVNFQRWINGIWAPQTGSAPSIDAIALNFENCTTDVLIEHTGSTGKVQGTDNFLKTQIALNAPLYEVGQDPRKITVGKKGADFTSISASVAYITDSAEDNRYVIEVGPGQFTENTIDLTGKPYVSIVGSNIQTTQIFPSASNQHIIKMGINNEVSFLSLANAGSGYSALYIDDVGDFAQAHKISINNCDRGITINASTTDTQFYGEYIDINGAFTYGAYVSSSGGASTYCNLENYYLFPSASATIGNYAVGPSSSLNLYVGSFIGDGTTNSTAVKLEDGATLEAGALDVQGWDYGYVVPNVGNPPLFRVVGSMIHDSTTYDFDIQKVGTQGRYQGISDHTKINSVSEDFYWNFLDDTDGENDITRKLSVTFADGTHTDATTLIFKGSSMGVLEGGTITISGSLTVTTAAGYGYLHDPINPEVFKRFDWVNQNITLSPNTNNYIYINSNGVLSAAGSTPNFAQNIILGRVVTNDTGVELIDQSPWNAEHTANRLSKFNREALGPVFAEGSIVTENVTPFKLDVTQGSYYFSENNFLPAGTSSINLTQYYQSASVWARYTSSIVPNNVYASSSALVAMSASAYTKHTVYLVGDGVDEEYFLVINNNQYNTLVETEGADLPTIPTYFNDGVVPLAAVYVQSGSANITQIQDIRPIIGFRAAGVNASAVHGNLLGLNADDHTQYLLVDGGRQMSGDLGLGGNDLYNANLISGSNVEAPTATIANINATSITGSLLGNATSATTASYILQAVSASFASTASFVLNAVSSSFASTSSIATSASFATSASQAQNALTASYILASGVAGLNLTQIATGSVTASVSPSQFSVVSGSVTEFVVTGTGTRIGSVITDTHTITGSVNISGSTTISGSLIALNTNTTNSLIVGGAYTSSATNQYHTIYNPSIATRNASGDNVYSLQINPQYTVNNSQTVYGLLVAPNVTVNSAHTFVNQRIAHTGAGAQNMAIKGLEIDINAGGGNPGNKIGIDIAGFTQFNPGSTVSAGIRMTDINVPYLLMINNANNQACSTVMRNNAGSTLVQSLSGTTGGNSADIYTTGTTVPLRLGVNSLIYFQIFNSSGNVGINTNTDAGFRLDVSGSTRLNGDTVVTGSFTVVTGSARELQVRNVGVDIGSIITDTHTVTGSFNISGSLNAPIITGSLFGTASWANNTLTASFVQNAQSSSFASTASFVQNAQSASYVLQAVSASFATTASFVLNAVSSSFASTSSIATSASFASTSSIATSASFATTASFAVSASWAPSTATSITVADEGSTQGTATYFNFTGAGVTATVSSNTASISIPGGAGATFPFTGSAIISGSLIVTGSTISTLGFTGSLEGTASWANNAISASYVLQAVSSSFASTASFVQNAQTASYVLQAVSASFATSASQAQNAVTASYVLQSVSSSFASTASFVQLAQSASYILQAVSSSFASTSSIATSSSFASTASFVQNAQSASYVLQAVSSSFASTSSIAISASFATTASFAVSASWAPSTGGSGLRTKAGSVANTSFTGNPRKATVTFGAAFTDTNYAITVTGEDARSWTIESKLAGSFVINANSNPALAGTTYWIATAYGETT